MKSEFNVKDNKPAQLSGWINGFIGILLFSGSMPATKVAVSGMPVLFVTGSRSAIAGILALFTVFLLKSKLPTKKHFSSIIIVVTGAVLGFPLLSAFALQYMTSARSLVFVGMLPLSTAIFGVIRGGERPQPMFWLFAILGSIMVGTFAMTRVDSSSSVGDLIMLAAVIVCGLGYAEGAKLSKELAGWEVISWALIISLPISALLVILFMPAKLSLVNFNNWFSLGYLGLFSQFLGFVFWYRGLALGGIATVGQLQLLQTFFGLAIAALLLHEQVSVWMIAVCCGVIICVAASRKFAKKQISSIQNSSTL